MTDSADSQRGRGPGGGVTPRRSPLDVIMSQIRRKRSASDRKPLGRFLSWSPESGPEENNNTNNNNNNNGVTEGEREPGWGRVSVFLQRLGKRSDSRNLSLTHCDLTATDLLELATLLQFLPELEELDVSWNDLIGGSLSALTFHLRHVGGVRTLRLCGCRLNADDVTALGEAVGGVPHLELLDLSWNGGVGGGALPDLLAKLRPPLRELHLVSCQLTAADAAALGGALPALTGLSVLDVSWNPRLAQEAGGGLGAALSQAAAALSELRLQACGLTADGLDALGAALRRLPELRRLDLSANKRLGGGLGRLARHLAHLSHLEDLQLRLCCLTRADLQALVQVLPSLTALRSLDVSSNQEAGGVVEALVAALPLAQMERLPLSACGLTVASYGALSVAAPYLRCVDVSWCKVVGGRAAPLLDALSPAHLLELRLCSCDLTTDDLRHLAGVCRSLSRLRVLDVSYNGAVEAGGWAALWDGAGGMTSLQEADLSLRPSTSASCSAWLPALLRALAGLPALTRLAARRWTMAPKERRRLEHRVRGRGLLLEVEPELGEAPCGAANRESPEE